MPLTASQILKRVSSLVEDMGDAESDVHVSLTYCRNGAKRIIIDSPASNNRDGSRDPVTPLASIRHGFGTPERAKAEAAGPATSSHGPRSTFMVDGVDLCKTQRR